MPKISASPSKNFAETLDELIAFKEYFTDNEKSKVLGEWVHKETGINIVVCRIAIKHIAPFLIIRLADVGQIVGQKWMAQLHDKLGDYEWYFNFTQNLLNTLKTRTENTLGEAFTVASTEHLAALFTPARWESLSSEQQGLVQLLIGQNQHSEAHDLIRSEIVNLQFTMDQLLNSLLYDLALETPDQIIREPRESEKGTVAWLNYSAQSAKLIGREKSLMQLDDFFNLEDNFAWWTITGEGGTGKSRLALETIKLQEPLWEVGFFNNKKLENVDSLYKWSPSSPTVIVIDYGAEYPSEIGDWINQLIIKNEEGSLLFPVRLLILERHSEQMSWWEYLTVGSRAAIDRQNYLHTRKPLNLLPLSKTEQKEALFSYLESLGSKLLLKDIEEEFWASLTRLSGNGKPLFIGMIAIAINSIGTKGIRDWKQEELLNDIYIREKRTWSRLLDQELYTLPQKKSAYDFLAFCTIISGADWVKNEEKITKALMKCQIIKERSEIDELVKSVGILTGNIGTVQPDLFGEYYVLRHWSVINGRPIGILKKRLCTAQKISPESTHSFIRQCAIDFPLNESTRRWWDNLFSCTKSEKQKDKLYSLTHQIITKLMEAKTHTLWEHWLSVLVESNEPKHQNKAMSMLAKQKTPLHYGEINNSLSYLRVKQESLLSTSVNTSNLTKKQQGNGDSYER